MCVLLCFPLLSVNITVILVCSNDMLNYMCKEVVVSSNGILGSLEQLFLHPCLPPPFSSE